MARRQQSAVLSGVKLVATLFVHQLNRNPISALLPHYVQVYEVLIPRETRQFQIPRNTISLHYHLGETAASRILLPDEAGST